MTAPVLVVGAGPVGLTAANALARLGVPVRIIDSRAKPTRLSKALVIWRRSLHTLDPLVPLEQWLQHGRAAGGLFLADNGGIFGRLDLQDPTATTAAADAPSNPACQHMLPPGILVTQAQVEAQLEQHLKERYGISVDRSTQLKAFTVDEANGQVRCVLAPAQVYPQNAGTGPAEPNQPNTTTTTTTSNSNSGKREEFMVSYLIGCDGGHSTVRKMLQVPFPGYSDPDCRFLMMDCTYEPHPGINSNTPRSSAEGLPQLGSVMVSTTAVGVVGVFPMCDPPGAVRLIWNAGKDGPAQPTLADFQSVLLTHTRLQMKLKEVLWQSEFSVNERQVDSYVHHGGRVLLAGDAAHVHSPAGGQGMNTGIQDATNLAWKVALAAAGDMISGSQLLQTYQEERHPAGEDAIKLSGTLLRANTIRGVVPRFIRRVVLSILTRIPQVRSRVVPHVTEDAISYTNSSLARPAAAATAATAARCAGTAFPDASVTIDGKVRPATDLLRGGDGSCGTLVVLQSQGLDPPEGVSEGLGGVQQDGSAAVGTTSDPKAAWPTHWGHWPLHVVPLQQRQQQQQQGSTSSSSSSGTSGAVDTWGFVSKLVGGASGVLVRPDGIIAAAGGPDVVRGWLQVHGFA